MLAKHGALIDNKINMRKLKKSIDFVDFGLFFFLTRSLRGFVLYQVGDLSVCVFCRGLDEI